MKRMWLRRVQGAQLEVVHGIETTLGASFEVDDAFGKLALNDKTGRFEAAPKTTIRTAERAAVKDAAHPVSTGPGGIPADEVKETPTTTTEKARERMNRGA